MKNNEETKEKITHHVHVNGMKSKISERFIDTNVFNKPKMDISDSKSELRGEKAERKYAMKAVEDAKAVYK